MVTRALIRCVAVCSLLGSWVASSEALAQSLTLVPSTTTVRAGQVVDFLATIQDTAPFGDVVQMTGGLDMSFGDGGTASTNFLTGVNGTVSASYTFQYVYATPGMYTAQLIGEPVTVATFIGPMVSQTMYAMLPGPSISIDVLSAVPEPSSVALTLVGLTLAVASRRRRPGAAAPEFPLPDPSSR